MYKDEKHFLFYKYKDEKLQWITPRYILSDWGTPPRQNTIYSHSKLKAQ